MRRGREFACSLRADQQGAVMVEALVAFVPIFLLFVVLCQVADGYAHQLIVRRAASAAARAAVVVLPDDGDHYGDPGQHTVDQASRARMHAIEAAALTVLGASPSFSAKDTEVRVSGGIGPSVLTTATVHAAYTCFLPGVSLLCGTDRKITLEASASLPYQFASYRYAPQRGG